VSSGALKYLKRITFDLLLLLTKTKQNKNKTKTKQEKKEQKYTTNKTIGLHRIQLLCKPLYQSASCVLCLRPAQPLLV